MTEAQIVVVEDESIVAEHIRRSLQKLDIRFLSGKYG